MLALTLFGTSNLLFSMKFITSMILRYFHVDYGSMNTYKNSFVFFRMSALC